MKKLFKFIAILILFLSIFSCSTYYYYTKDLTYRWDENKQGWLVTGASASTVDIKIPNTIGQASKNGKNKVIGIDDYAFTNNTKIKTLTLNDNIKYIGTRAFEDSSLEGTLDLHNVTWVADRAFNGTNLTLIQVPNTLTKMGNLSINPSKEVKNQLKVIVNMFEDGKTNLPQNRGGLTYDFDANWFDKNKYNNVDSQIKFLGQFSISQAPYLEVRKGDAPITLTIDSENEEDKKVTWERVDSQLSNKVISSTDSYVNVDLTTGRVSFKSRSNDDNDSITLRATSVNTALEPSYIIIKARYNKAPVINSTSNGLAYTQNSISLVKESTFSINSTSVNGGPLKWSIEGPFANLIQMTNTSGESNTFKFRHIDESKANNPAPNTTLATISAKALDSQRKADIVYTLKAAYPNGLVVTPSTVKRVYSGDLHGLADNRFKINVKKAKYSYPELTYTLSVDKPANLSFEKNAFSSANKDFIISHSEFSENTDVTFSLIASDNPSFKNNVTVKYVKPITVLDKNYEIFTGTNHTYNVEENDQLENPVVTYSSTTSPNAVNVGLNNLISATNVGNGKIKVSRAMDGKIYYIEFPITVKYSTNPVLAVTYQGKSISNGDTILIKKGEIADNQELVVNASNAGALSWKKTGLKANLLNINSLTGNNIKLNLSTLATDLTLENNPDPNVVMATLSASAAGSLKPEDLSFSIKVIYDNDLKILDSNNQEITNTTRIYTGDLHNAALNANNKFKFKVKKNANSDPRFTYTLRSSNTSVAPVDTNNFSDNEKEYIVTHNPITANTSVDFTISSAILTAPKTLNVIYVEEIKVNNFPPSIELGKNVVLDVKENDQISPIKFFVLEKGGTERSLNTTAKNTVNVISTSSGSAVIRVAGNLDGKRYYKDYNTNLTFTPSTDIKFFNAPYIVIQGKRMLVEVQRTPVTSTEPISIELKNPSDAQFLKEQDYNPNEYPSVIRNFTALKDNRHPIPIVATIAGKTIETTVLIKNNSNESLQRVEVPITSFFMNNLTPHGNQNTGAADLDDREEYSKFEITVTPYPSGATNALFNATYKLIHSTNTIIDGISIEKDSYTGIPYLIIDNEKIDKFINKNKGKNIAMLLEIRDKGNLVYNNNIVIYKPNLESISLDSSVKEIEFSRKTFTYPSTTFDIKFFPKYSYVSKDIYYTPNDPSNTIVFNIDQNNRTITFSPTKAMQSSGILSIGPYEKGARNVRTTPVTITVKKYLVDNRDKKYGDVNADLKALVNEGISIKGPTVDLNQIDTRNVTDISNLFYNNATFNGTLDEWDSSNFVKAERAFEGAATFDQVIFNLNNIRNMNYMFKNATNYSHKGKNNIFEAQSAAELKEIFAGNHALSYFEFKTPSAQTILGAFKDSFINDVTFGDMHYLSNASHLFENVKNFGGKQAHQSFNPNNVYEEVVYRDYSYMFAGSSFEADGHVAESYEFFKLKKIGIPITLEGMFKNSNLYVSFDGFNNWDTSDVVSMKDMFNGAINFNAEVSYFNTSNVTDMSGMFKGAENFRGLSYDNVWRWDVSNVVTTESMFEGTKSLDPENGTKTRNEFLKEQGTKIWYFKKNTNYKNMFKDSGFTNKDNHLSSLTFPQNDLILDGIFENTRNLELIVDRASNGYRTFDENLAYERLPGFSPRKVDKIASFERMLYNADKVTGNFYETQGKKAVNNLIIRYADIKAVERIILESRVYMEYPKLWLSNPTLQQFP